MGKGGTRFVSESLSVRSGRQRSTYTNAELRKNMERYLKTGEHPEMANQSHEVSVSNLPDSLPSRPRAFLDLKIGRESIGRLVIELYDDLVPISVNHFVNRCSPGAADTLKGTKVHKLLPHFAAFFGKSNRTITERLDRHRYLVHVQPGAVSVSLSGDEVVIALGPAVALDSTHQVVGKVSRGIELLDRINEVTALPGDEPVEEIKVANCGDTNEAGVHDALNAGGSSSVAETPQEAADRLNEDCSKAREGVRSALEEGLGNKRKPADGADKSDHGKRRRTGMFASMLDGLGEPGSDSSSDSED